MINGVQFINGYKWVDTYYNGVKIAGSQLVEVSGEIISVAKTYNDSAFVRINGNTQEIGEGDKSPDNPYELKSVGDDGGFDLVSAGKNLFDPSILETPRTNSGVTVQYLSNEDCLLINGMASVSSGVPSSRVYINIPIVNGSRFTISTKYISGAVTRPTGSEFAVAYFGANDTIDSSVNWAACHLQNTDNVRENAVCNYNYITAFWIYSNAGVIYDNYKVKIQLEQNTVATPYTPFRGMQTINFPYPLRGQGDARDTIEYIGGNRWRHTQRLGVKVFDGTENWRRYSDYNQLYIGNTDAVFGEPFSSQVCCMSTHYKAKAFNDRGVFENNTCAVGGTGANIVIFTDMSLLEFLDFLTAQYAAGTPVTVYYQLAEPIITEFTAPAPQTYYPYTQMYTNAEIFPTLEGRVRVIDN